MRVTNIHRRILNRPKEKVSELFRTLATKNDMIWPYESWPAIQFKDGLNKGSKGGHGIIRYTIIDFKDGEHIKFRFVKPSGFNGTHQLDIIAIDENNTEIVHEINMATSFKATVLWLVVIRWLHDALIEEAFDKVENHFSEHKVESEYNSWVKLLRSVYKRKSVKTKYA